jgi:hypothetical protein
MKRALTILTALVFFTLPTHATLIDRGPNFIYIPERNITILKDWNLAANLTIEEISRIIGDSNPLFNYVISIKDFEIENGQPTGRMTWFGAQAWANGLHIASYDDWVIPLALPFYPVQSCSGSYFGYDCLDSHIAHVWYSELGNIGGGYAGHSNTLTNTGPFTNINPAGYWESELVQFNLNSFDNSYAIYFYAGNGFQAEDSLLHFNYAVAVRYGDVLGEVPEPPTIFLVILGLVVVYRVIRDRKAKLKIERVGEA